MLRHRHFGFLIALGLSLTVAAGCVGTMIAQGISQGIMEKHLKEAKKYHNPYTNQKYEVMEDSLKATRDHFSQDLARVTPLREPLPCKATVIIPSEAALQDYYARVAKASQEWQEMQMRATMPDYDKFKEKYKGITAFDPMGFTAEVMKNTYDHMARTDEVRYDFLVDALKRRKLFQDVAVQKAREMGSASPAVPSGSGVVIYLVAPVRPKPNMQMQNLWHLKVAGSEDPWLLGSDESPSGWMTNIEKTAREQLKPASP